MRRALLVVLLVVVAVTGLLWAVQRRLVYLPQGTPGPVPAGAREVSLTTDDGLRLGGWFFPGDDGAPAVLVANGNGGNRGLRAPLAEALQDAGLSVLLFDYRGYGGNPGSPSEDGLALDVRAARAFLLDHVPADRLIYFGESLGCAVVTELATEHPPAALVLRSPFRDLAAVGSVHYPFLPVRLLLRDSYPVEREIARVGVPTTVVYGTADTIVPPEQSRAVADAAGRPHRLVAVPGADHNDPVLLDGPQLIDAVLELAGQLD